MTDEKKGKGFFALDVDQFFKIQDKGLGIEEAATYLALMKGTDQSNTISRGGVNSVMEYTGLARSEAKRAIANLARVELLQVLDVERIRARTAERYRLPPHEGRQPLTALEASVVADLELGLQPTTTKDKNTAFRAGQKGWIEKLSTGWAAVPASQRIAFIPNMFVDMPGHTSPLKRLVQIGEIGPTMLAAEIYHKQDLMNERGVPTNEIRAYYRSALSLTAGKSQSGYRLHKLTRGRLYDEWDKEAKKNVQQDASASCNSRAWRAGLWDNLRALEGAGICEWAVYSANGKPAGDHFSFNRPQRPLGVLRNGKHVRNTPEASVALLSYMMWCEQNPSGQWKTPETTSEEMGAFWRDHGPIIAVESAQVSHVEGVGILRMAYRAETENTAQWFRDLHKEKDASLFFLETVCKAAFPEMVMLQWDSDHLAKSVSAISK